MSAKSQNRIKALETGEMYYIPESPCHKGHLLRFSKTGNCKECQKLGLEQRRRRRGIKPRSKMSHDEFLAKRRVLSRKYKANNRKKLAQESRDYYYAHHEDCKAKNRERSRAAAKENSERARQWAKANPVRRKAIEQTRRARKLSAKGNFAADDIEQLLYQQEGRCATCHRYFPGGIYHIDHIQPLAKGGSNFPSNLQLLCPTCNCSKKHTPIDVWTGSEFTGPNFFQEWLVGYACYPRIETLGVIENRPPDLLIPE